MFILTLLKAVDFVVVAVVVVVGGGGGMVVVDVIVHVVDVALLVVTDHIIFTCVP